MNRLFCLFLIALLPCIARSQWRLGAYSDIVLPVDTTVFVSGFGVGINIEYTIDSKYSVVLRSSYIPLTKKYSSQSVSGSVITNTLIYRVNILSESKWILPLSLGFGALTESLKDKTTDRGKTSTGVLMSVSLGVGYRLSESLSALIYVGRINGYMEGYESRYTNTSLELNIGL